VHIIAQIAIFLNIKRSILGALIHPPFFGMTVIVSALWEICCAGDDVRAESLGFGFGVGDDPDAHRLGSTSGGVGEGTVRRGGCP
jgi:hypothetical protein